MYSKQYLLYGGGVLILSGVLGLSGILGPMAESSIFGNGWYFSLDQSWVNIIFGLISVSFGLSSMTETRRWAAGIIAGLAALTGLASLFMPTSFAAILGESPVNATAAIFYLAIGGWGLWTTLSGAEKPTTHGMIQRA